MDNPGFGMSDNGQATLERLEQRMSALVDGRNAIVHRAEQVIEAANKDFDRVAVPLGREIQKFKTALQVQAKQEKASRPPAKPKRPPDLVGLSDEEKRYFNALQR